MKYDSIIDAFIPSPNGQQRNIEATRTECRNAVAESFQTTAGGSKGIYIYSSN